MDKKLIEEAIKLLRDIDLFGGLKQGGEQYPNGLNCLDIADRLETSKELFRSELDAAKKKLAEQQAKLIRYVDPEHLLQKPSCCDEGVNGSGECCGNGACSWKAKNLFVGGFGRWP